MVPAALEVPFLSSRLRHACSDHLRGLKAWVLNKTKHTKPQRGGRQKLSVSQGRPAAKALALPGAVLGEHTWVASWVSSKAREVRLQPQLGTRMLLAPPCSGLGKTAPTDAQQEQVNQSRNSMGDAVVPPACPDPDAIPQLASPRAMGF